MSKEYPSFFKYVIFSVTAIIAADGIKEFLRNLQENAYKESELYGSIGICAVLGGAQYLITRNKERKEEIALRIQECERQAKIKSLNPNKYSTIEDKVE